MALVAEAALGLRFLHRERDDVADENVLRDGELSERVGWETGIQFEIDLEHAYTARQRGRFQHVGRLSTGERRDKLHRLAAWPVIAPACPEAGGRRLHQPEAGGIDLDGLARDRRILLGRQAAGLGATQSGTARSQQQFGPGVHRSTVCDSIPRFAGYLGNQLYPRKDAGCTGRYLGVLVHRLDQPVAYGFERISARYRVSIRAVLNLDRAHVTGINRTVH